MRHPYATTQYAESLPHIGRAFEVPEWGCYVIERPIANSSHRDVVGAYPVAALAMGADLAGGFRRLKAAGFISLVLVLEDFWRPQLGELRGEFDIVRGFKQHYVFDRALGDVVYDRYHRHKIRRALGRVEVSEIALGDHLAAWQSLYQDLSDRHKIVGIHAFPERHHQALAILPGVRTFGAFLNDRLVSAHIFVVYDGGALSHLTASSSDGYAVGAAYAVNDFALKQLVECRMINFGGAAGLEDDPADGLVRFKKGFSNSVVGSHLCGKILDPAAYSSLCAGTGQTDFFPAYRRARASEPTAEAV